MASNKKQLSDEQLLADLEREESELADMVIAEKAAQEAALPALHREFRERKRNEARRHEDVTDSEYWFCVCFQTRAQKEAFLKELNWHMLGDKYIDGVALAEGTGITLPSVDLRVKINNEDKKLSEISLPLT